MKRILIIGRNGQVSSYLQTALAALIKGNEDDLEVIAASRDQVDLSKTDEIQSALERIRPFLVINPAAYTAVDLAEEQSDQAFLINHMAVEQIANYCARTSTPLIHFSTDYVFDGCANQPYTESDEPAPTGVYGQSKLEGERAILNSSAPAIILRTSWVYSNHGKNFYKTMLMLAESRDEISVVADQIGSPTYAGCIADTCKLLVEQILHQGQILNDQMGIFHFTCEGQTSWSEFATAIYAATGHSQMKVNAIGTKDYPTPAKRPAYSVLSGARLSTVFGLALPDWQQGLAECVAAGLHPAETH